METEVKDKFIEADYGAFKLKIENVHPKGKDWMFRKSWDYGNDAPRKDVLKFFDEPFEKKFTLLDVGCASGKTLKYLRAKYPYAKLFGIEPEASLAEKAREQCEVFACGVEDFIKGNPYGTTGFYDFEGYFDYIMFNDVLEHLFDPWTVVRDMTGFVKVGGHFMGSIPNICHIDNVYNLLHGRFCYGTDSIINKEHLRFFTLYEVVDMLETCGYGDIQYGVNANTTVTPELKELIKKLEAIYGKNDMNNYEAFQYIVKGKKL